MARPASSTHGRSQLRQGARGQDVRELQTYLARFGIDVGPIDGQYGPRTAQAVREFQRMAGISQDGVAGPQTWSHVLHMNHIFVQGGNTPDWWQGSAPTDSVSKNNIESRIREEFPGLAPFLDNPEIRDLVTQAAEEGWTSERFQAELRGTEWWQETTQRGQQWRTLPPAEREQRIDQIYSQLETSARDTYGPNRFNSHFPMDLSTGQNSSLRHRAMLIASGQSTMEEQRLALHQVALRDPGTAAAIQQLERQEQLARRKKRPEEIAEELWREARGEYFVNLSKDAARNWANQILSGESSFGEFSDHIRQQASKLYPGFADQIANGILPKDLFSPALQTLSGELEMSEEAIIGSDKLWGEITKQASGKEGETFTAADWTRYARSQPEWRQTMNANQKAADLAMRIGQTFGKV